jgi:putative polyhydroxyalkanoate system protein
VTHVLQPIKLEKTVQNKNTDSPRLRRGFLRDTTEDTMARPVSVTIPHSLGKAEARKRIETGFGQMRQNMLGGAAGMLAKMITIQDRWEGDQLHFEGSGMGQKLTGRLDVRDDAVQIEIDLPEMLAAIADKIKGTLKTEGQKLLEKK